MYRLYVIIGIVCSIITTQKPHPWIIMVFTKIVRWFAPTLKTLKIHKTSDMSG